MNLRITGRCPTCLSCGSWSREPQWSSLLTIWRPMDFYRCCSRPIGASTPPRLLCWRFCPMFWPRSTRRRSPYWPCWTSCRLWLCGPRHFTVQVAVQVWSKWCCSGSRHQLAKLTISQLPLATTTSSSTVNWNNLVSTANDLGVILDSQLHDNDYTRLVCLPCRFYPATSAAVSSPISDDRGDTCLGPGFH